MKLAGFTVNIVPKAGCPQEAWDPAEQALRDLSLRYAIEHAVRTLCDREGELDFFRVEVEITE